MQLEFAFLTTMTRGFFRGLGYEGLVPSLHRLGSKPVFSAETRTQSPDLGLVRSYHTSREFSVPHLGSARIHSRQWLMSQTPN